MSFLLPYQKNQLEELSEALSTDRVSGSVPKVAIHKEQLH
ncbi:hypothetical protein LEP1GSC168_2385 [Leptospira santarosai str. HAI134]|nr:hypothetical protein LEP1GSC168_2385 [Leptospira santarosai str. HAI134]